MKNSNHLRIQEAADILAKFGVPYEIRISSAHRSPARTMTLASEAAAAEPDRHPVAVSP